MMSSANSSVISELRADNLSYEINDTLILKQINFSVKSGELLFIEGSNGSGKTTLLRILCGLMQADEGQVKWNGAAIEDDRLEYNQQLTFIGHNTGVKAELTTLENIQFFSALSGLTTNGDRETAIDRIGLKTHINSPGRHLSYGQQRRIALTRLFMETSKLWILDEPFSGLDKDMIISMQQHFTEHVKRGGIVVLTSHQHIELEQLTTVRIRLGV